MKDVNTQALQPASLLAGRYTCRIKGTKSPSLSAGACEVGAGPGTVQGPTVFPY